MTLNVIYTLWITATHPQGQWVKMYYHKKDKAEFLIEVILGSNSLWPNCAIWGQRCRSTLAHCTIPLLGPMFKAVIFHWIFAKHWCWLFQIQIEEVEETPLQSASRPEGYRLLDLECLGAALAAASLCAVCKVGHLQIQEGGRAGWASELILSCSSCTHTYPFWTSPMAQSSGSTYGPNPRQINQWVQRSSSHHIADCHIYGLVQNCSNSSA